MKDITKEIKYPNKRVFVLSDTHFGHENIIKYCRNKYASIEEMDEDIINRINSVVQHDDILIILGDYAFSKSRIQELNKRINGHKYIIIGNHDDEKYILSNANALGFEGAYNVPVILQLQGKKYVLSHYPIDSDEQTPADLATYSSEFKELTKNDPEVLNLHGHIHPNENGIVQSIGPNKQNIGIDYGEHKPTFIGNTKEFTVQKDKIDEVIDYLLSPQFATTLNYISENGKKFNETLALKNYLYSIIVELLFIIEQDFIDNENMPVPIIISGSYLLSSIFGGYGPYSDLDVNFNYNPNESIKNNTTLFSEFSNTAYNKINELSNNTAKYLKRMKNIKQIINTFCMPSHEIIKGKSIQQIIDINQVLLPIFKSEDIKEVEYQPFLVKIFNQNHIKLPLSTVRYTAFTNLASLATYILQYIYQKPTIELTQKINRLYRECKTINLDVLRNTLIRFIIKNVYFMHYTGRRDEEKQILNSKLEDILYTIENSDFNLELKSLLNLIFQDLDGEFWTVINTIKSINNPEKFRSELENVVNTK